MSKKIVVCGSLAQAAGLLEIPREILSAVKNHGCPAFRSGRVNLDALADWLREHLEDLETVSSKNRDALYVASLRYGSDPHPELADSIDAVLEAQAKVQAADAEVANLQSQIAALRTGATA